MQGSQSGCFVDGGSGLAHQNRNSTLRSSAVSINSLGSLLGRRACGTNRSSNESPAIQPAVRANWARLNFLVYISTYGVQYLTQLSQICLNASVGVRRLFGVQTAPSRPRFLRVNLRSWKRLPNTVNFVFFLRRVVGRGQFHHDCYGSLPADYLAVQHLTSGLSRLVGGHGDARGPT
jgi:hypothetical protein